MTIMGAQLGTAMAMDIIQIAHIAVMTYNFGILGRRWYIIAIYLKSI